MGHKKCHRNYEIGELNQIALYKYKQKPCLELVEITEKTD